MFSLEIRVSIFLSTIQNKVNISWFSTANDFKFSNLDMCKSKNCEECPIRRLFEAYILKDNNDQDAQVQSQVQLTFMRVSGPNAYTRSTR